MEKELEKRLTELWERAADRCMYIETAFLTEGEQAHLPFLFPSGTWRTEGGFPEAERKIAVFGREEDMGYEWENTLAFLKIEPKDQKFADNLTHRDFLGALLNLGIKRELLGDIVIQDNVGYLVALEQIAPFLEENLTRVRHTSVRTLPLKRWPEQVGVLLEEKTVVSASLRLDALIAAVWNLSRSEAKEAVEKEKVSVKGKIISDPSYSVSEGVRISVRGYGRFYCDGIVGETRSGRCRVKIRLFV